MKTTTETIDQLIERGQLPQSYAAILASFEVYYEGELVNGDEINLYSKSKLLEPLTENLVFHQAVAQFIQDNQSKHSAGKIYSRTTDSEVDVTLFEKTFYFGTMNDNDRLFFRLDDQSIWAYWLDDGSVAKLADDWAIWMLGFEVSDRD